MSYRRSLVLLAVVLVGAATFVVVTGRSLPTVVASHFGFAGDPDGQTTRAAYLTFMTAFVTGLPLFVTVVAHFAGTAGSTMNLPRADRWGSQAHRRQAVDLLRRRLLLLAATLACFLGYVHWLVVRANTAPEVHLSNAAMYGGLAVFLVFVVAWTVSLHRRFANGPAS